MSAWRYVDNSSFEGLVHEAIIQTVFWTVALIIIRHFIRGELENDGLRSIVSSHEGGADELLIWLTAIPQHTTSVILLWIGIAFKRTDIFRTGVLSEFAYETFDLFNAYIQYFFFSKPSLTKKEKENKLLAMQATTFHHLPGLIVIIPAVNHFAEHPNFQRVVCSLLAYTPCLLSCIAAYKCCNIKDVEGRKRFNFYYGMTLLISTWGRFIWCPMEMYAFLINTFWEQTFFMKCGLIFYAILIYAFNLLVEITAIQRFYKYLYGTKINEAETVKAASRLRRSSVVSASGSEFDLLRDENFQKQD